MSFEQAMPIALYRNQSDVDPFVYFARSGSGDTLRLIQFGLHRTPPLYAYGPGVRDHDLIHFVFSGCGDVTMAGRRFHVRCGELFFIPSHCVSYYQADECTPWVYAWIGFDGAWGRAMLESTGLSAAHPIADMRDMPRVYGIVSAMREQMFEPCGYLPLLAGALRLLDELVRGPAARAPQGDAPRPDTEHLRIDHRINDVITLLDQRYLEPLNVQKLADEMQLSRTYLSEQFSRRAGCSIKAYVTRLRMQHACMRMNDARLSVRQVAGECGYDDPLYFSRVFKKIYGMSPQHYREAMWKNGESGVSGVPVKAVRPMDGSEEYNEN